MSEKPETPEPAFVDASDDLKILKTGPQEDKFNGLAESESVLARDWNTPEEEVAWTNL